MWRAAPYSALILRSALLQGASRGLILRSALLQGASRGLILRSALLQGASRGLILRSALLQGASRRMAAGSIGPSACVAAASEQHPSRRSLRDLLRVRTAEITRPSS